MEEERYDRAENRMESGRGNLARYTMTYRYEMDLEKGRIIGKEK